MKLDVIQARDGVVRYNAVGEGVFLGYGCNEITYHDGSVRLTQVLSESQIHNLREGHMAMWIGLDRKIYVARNRKWL